MSQYVPMPLCFALMHSYVSLPSSYVFLCVPLAFYPRLSFMSANSGRSKWEPLVWTMDQILFNFTEVFRMFLKKMYGWCLPLCESLLPPTGSPVSSPAYVPFVPHAPLWASVAVSSYVLFVPFVPMCYYVFPFVPYVTNVTRMVRLWAQAIRLYIKSWIFSTTLLPLENEQISSFKLSSDKQIKQYLSNMNIYFFSHMEDITIC